MFKVTSGPFPIYEKGEIVATEVTITQDKPYKFLNERIDGDYTKADTETLINLALEQNFKEVYQDRALGEVVQEFDGIKNAVEHVNHKVEEVRELANSVQDNADMVSGAILELMDTLTMKGLLDDEIVEEY